MKKNLKKKAVLTMSVALLLAVAVGITIAYIFTETDPVENTFKPSKVACAVVENGNDPVSAGNVTLSSKTNVQIKNTGDTDAYIRVAVVVNWMSADGTRVWATKPVKSTDGTDGDYTITYNLEDNGWIDGGDGYYYYTRPVAPCVHKDGDEHTGCMTSVLISSCTPVAGRAPDGYYLSVEIVASAIQSSGMGAESAQEAWAKAQQSANND